MGNSRPAKGQTTHRRRENAAKKGELYKSFVTG